MQCWCTLRSKHTGGGDVGAGRAVCGCAGAMQRILVFSDCRQQGTHRLFLRPAGTLVSFRAQLHTRWRPQLHPHLPHLPHPPSPPPQVSVHVCIFVFDLMYLDGRTLLSLPLEERRRLLLTALPGMREGHIQLAQGTVLHPPALRPAPPQAATTVVQTAVLPAMPLQSAAGEGEGRGRFTGAGEGGVGEDAESEGLGGGGEDLGGGVATEGGGREGVDTEHAEGLVEASITAKQAGASATAAAGAPPADEPEAGAAGTGDDGGSGVVAELGAQVMDLLLQSFNDGAEGERCSPPWYACRVQPVEWCSAGTHHDDSSCPHLCPASLCGIP